MAVTYMTAEGYKKLVDELNEMENVQRPAISKQIAEARDKGDLSENVEYDAAKDEQSLIESRIAEIEEILKNAEVVDEEDVDLKKINVGCQVKLLDITYNEEIVYTIVGSSEADSLNGKISNESPVGKALIGHKKGDTVEGSAQAGTFSYKILQIKRSN